MAKIDNSGVISSHGHALAELLSGQVLDGFEIGEPIGSGGMGTVFRATQVSVGRQVAVKVVQDAEGTAAERFLREARLVSSISHPNIVNLIEFGERPAIGVLFYAMDLIDGWSLNALLRSGRLHPNLTIELMAQMCSALAEAHACGVVHRDLKASNMLVSLMADGTARLRLLDFGIARLFDDPDHLTKVGTLCGTPTYMAPEQGAGDPVTALVDLYAAGINMYYMLTGALPFRDRNSVQIILKQMRDPPPSLDEYVAKNHIPAPLAALCMELLEKQPSDRPQSAGIVRERLLSIREELGWGALAVAPPDEAGLELLIRPKLAKETEPAPAGWLPPNDSTSTSELRVTSTDVDMPSVEAPSFQRSGGGWSAFNSTGPAADDAHHQHVLSPVTGEFMAASADPPGAPEVPEAATAKPAPVPRTRVAGGRRFSAQELVPNLPPKPEPVPPPPPPPEEGVGKYFLVALLAFVVCAVIVAVVTRDDASDKMSRRDAAAVSTPNEEPAAEKPPPKKSTRKARKSKAEKEVIDVFEDAVDPPDKPPIIIEEAP